MHICEKCGAEHNLMGDLCLICQDEKIMQLRSALIGLVGSENKEELEAMEAVTRTAMAAGTVPQKDGTAMLNAIHAIIDTKDV